MSKLKTAIHLTNGLLATEDTPTDNKSLVITNNTPGAISVLDAVATDDDQVVFEQSLKLLKTATGADSIPSLSSGTVTLDDYHMSNNVLTYSKLYDLIYVKPGTLFPVKSQGIMEDFKTRSYAPVTVTADDVKVMQQTEAFLQNVAAYPTSTLAQDYTSALQSTTDTAADPNDIDSQVANFFATKKEYNLVTLDSVMALNSYYNTFPMVWTDYQSTKTYYFYASDGTTVTSKGSLTIEIPSTIGLDKTLPGFKFTYTDENNQSIPLFYSEGLFVENTDVDLPHISIAGTFVVKSTLTKVDTDVDIIPILTGTIYTHPILGYDTPLTPAPSSGNGDDGDGWSGLYTLLHPKDAAGAAQLFLEFVGLVMGIDFFFGKPLRALKDKMLDKLEDAGVLSPDVVDKLRTEVRDRSGLNDPKYQAKMKKLGLQDQATKSLADQMKDVDAKYQDRLTEDWRTATDIKLDKMSDMLQKMLDSGHVTQDMEDAGDSIADSYNSVDLPSTADLSKQISDLNTTVENLRLNINDQFSAIMSKLKGTALTEINDAKVAAENAKATVDKVTDDLNKAKDGTPDSGKPKESGTDVEDLT